MALINESTSTSRTVALTRARGTRRAPPRVERLQAPSVHARRRRHASAARTYGAATYTGALTPPQTQPVAGAAGTYLLKLPRGSAALVTFGS